MEHDTRRRLLALAGASLAPAAIAPRLASAQDWPSRPVRFIVPFPPGGANDVLARLLGVQLSASLGQQVIVDNRGGANTIIGCDLTAKATPDGYTILIVPGSHAINPSLYRALPYDTLRDFAAVSLIGNGAYVLLANPALPARSVEELLALARAKPGRSATRRPASETSRTSPANCLRRWGLPGSPMYPTRAADRRWRISSAGTYRSISRLLPPPART